MLNILDKINQPQASAKVVEGKLILSLPNALKPTVWQMNFEQYAASSLEVSDQDNKFILLLKTPDGKSVEVAPFASREDAVKGLVVASKALERGQSSSNFDGSGLSFKKILTPVLAVLFLFVLLSVWASLSTIEPGTMQQTSSSGYGSGAPVAAETGVPMSADAFLGAQ